MLEPILHRVFVFSLLMLTLYMPNLHAQGIEGWVEHKSVAREGVTFTLQVPPDWQADINSNGDLYLTSPREGQYSASLFLGNYELDSIPVNTAELVATHTFIARRDAGFSGGTYEELERKEVRVAGQEAVRLDVRRPWAGKSTRFRVYLFLLNGASCQIIFKANEEQFFERYLPMVDEMLATVTVRESQPILVDGKRWQSVSYPWMNLSQRRDWQASVEVHVDYPTGWEAETIAATEASAEREKGLLEILFRRPNSLLPQATLRVEGLRVAPHGREIYVEQGDRLARELLGEEVEQLERKAMDLPNLRKVTQDKLRRISGSGEVYRTVYSGSDALGRPARLVCFTFGSSTIAFHLAMLTRLEDLELHSKWAELMVSSMLADLSSTLPF